MYKNIVVAVDGSEFSLRKGSDAWQRQSQSDSFRWLHGNGGALAP